MKWWEESNRQKLQRKPFLVLPLNTEDKNTKKPKPMGIKLGTNCPSSDGTTTWPPKFNKRDSKSSTPRPKTATLEKPKLLNAKLVKFLDMSMVTKELLDIPNLCRSDTFLNKPKQLKASKKCSKVIKNIKKTVLHPEDKYIAALTKPKRSVVKVCSMKNIPQKDKNNNKTPPNPTKNTSHFRNDEVFHFGSEYSLRVPEPCNTCGRSDQPERFHSHPVTPRFQFRNSSPKVKFNQSHTSLIDTKSNPSNTSMKTTSSKKSTQSRPLSSHKKPNMKTCYICGKDFGSVSLTIHETKCLEKWARDNSLLPVPLRRSPPIRPDPNLPPEKYNTLAWKTSQNTLIPCENCGRTFGPDQIESHLRSCSPANTSSTWSSPGHGPPTVECYICHRKFGTHSIGIHEPQCLKKWHMQNDHLPTNARLPVPVRPDPSSQSRAKQTISFKQLSDSEDVPKTESSIEKNTLPCYVCRQEFLPHVLKTHEPLCLEKWKKENDKLPPHKRQEPPVRPDFIFKDDGQLDCRATFDRIWENHLDSLKECKQCGRRFFPDRIEKHEQFCDGSQKLKKK